MDIKKAIAILNKIDNLPTVNEITEDYNDHKLIKPSKLLDLDDELGNLYDEIELDAPFLFLNNGVVDGLFEKALKPYGYKIKRVTDEDAPYAYYIQCNNFWFGISQM